MPPKKKKTGVHGFTTSGKALKITNSTPKTGEARKVGVYTTEEKQRMFRATVPRAAPKRKSLADLLADEHEKKEAKRQKATEKEDGDFKPHSEDLDDDAADDENLPEKKNAAKEEQNEDAIDEVQSEEDGTPYQDTIDFMTKDEDGNMSNRRKQALRKHNAMLNRVFEDNKHLHDAEEDDISDIEDFSKDTGANYVLVPDETLRGTVGPEQNNRFIDMQDRTRLARRKNEEAPAYTGKDREAKLEAWMKARSRAESRGSARLSRRRGQTVEAWEKQKAAQEEEERISREGIKVRGVGGLDDGDLDARREDDLEDLEGNE